MAFPASTTVVDNFNRSTLGASWVNSSGTGLTIVSNQVAAAAAGYQQGRFSTPYGPDVDAYITVAAVQAYFELGLAHDIGGGVWRGLNVVVNGTTTTLQRDSTTLGTATVTWASGDKIGLSLSGPNITVFRQASGSGTWTALITVSDSTYAGVSNRNLTLAATSTSGTFDDLVIATAGVTGAFPASTTVTDDFNRATLGAGWSTTAGSGLTIQTSTQLKSAGSAGVYSEAQFQTDYGPNLDAYVTIANYIGSTLDLLILRDVGAGVMRGYHAQIAGSTPTTTLYRVDASGVSLATTTSVAWANGDKLGISIRSGTITVYRQASGSSTWTAVLTATDTTYTGSNFRLRIGLWHTTYLLDNLVITTVVPGGFTSGNSTPFTGTTILDTFDRASVGPPPGTNWTTPAGAAGGLAAINNLLGNPAAVLGSADWATTYGPGMAMSVTIDTLGANGDGVDLYAVLDDQDSGYMATLNFVTGAHMTQLWKRTNGLAERIDNGSNVVAAWAAGDGLALAVASGIVTIYRRPGINGTWTALNSGTDQSYRTNLKRPRVSIDNVTARLDDFAAAQIASAPVAAGTTIFELDRSFTRRGRIIV